MRLTFLDDKLLSLDLQRRRARQIVGTAKYRAMDERARAVARLAEKNC